MNYLTLTLLKKHYQKVELLANLLCENKTGILTSFLFFQVPQLRLAIIYYKVNRHLIEKLNNNQNIISKRIRTFISLFFDSMKYVCNLLFRFSIFKEWLVVFKLCCVILTIRDNISDILQEKERLSYLKSYFTLSCLSSFLSSVYKVVKFINFYFSGILPASTMYWMGFAYPIGALITINGLFDKLDLIVESDNLDIGSIYVILLRMVIAHFEYLTELSWKDYPEYENMLYAILFPSLFLQFLIFDLYALKPEQMKQGVEGGVKVVCSSLYSCSRMAKDMLNGTANNMINLFSTSNNTNTNTKPRMN